MLERQTARKVRIWDVMNGEFVKKEGFEPSFVKTPSGEEVSRARILGTVVSKFTADDGNYASVTIDDGSDTIRLKVFKTVKPIGSLEIGDVVDVIGKVREYEGETYVIPEVARRMDDPNFELMRRLELIYKAKKPKGTKPDSGSAKAKTEKPNNGAESTGTAKGTRQDKNEMKKELLKAIGSSKDGIVYSELMKQVKGKEAEIEAAVDELLNDGICYEPSPGKIRKI